MANAGGQPRGPQLKALAASDHEPAGWLSNQGDDRSVLDIKNQPLGGFRSLVESTMGGAVFDETGLNDRYDLHLEWKSGDGPDFQTALRDQLGLESVSTEPAGPGMLVVENENNSK